MLGAASRSSAVSGCGGSDDHGSVLSLIGVVSQPAGLGLLWLEWQQTLKACMLPRLESAWCCLAWQVPSGRHGHCAKRVSHLRFQHTGA